MTASGRQESATAIADEKTGANVTVMPLGTRHELTGLLVARQSALILELRDGRRWTLVAPVGIERFIDRKVRISGTRGEDGTLFVDTFGQAP